jgi:hypothetical protein
LLNIKENAQDMSEPTSRLHTRKTKTSKKRMEIMLKKIKQKLCELVCKVFGITQCLCSHECNCKKEKQ